MNRPELSLLSILILLASAPACSLSAHPNIDRWSVELQDKEPFEPPFVTIFRYGEKKLCFLESKHDPKLRIFNLSDNSCRYQGMRTGYPDSRRSSARHQRKRADRILVIYGSSHLATLRRALTEGSTGIVNKKYE